MFEIKDSEDVKLHENKSADQTLLKAEGVRRLDAAKNEAGFKKAEVPVSFRAKLGAFAGNVFVQVIGGVAVLVIGALLLKFWPGIFSK